VTFRRTASDLQMDYQGLSFEGAYTIDIRGRLGDRSVRPHFKSMRLRVAVQTEATLEQLSRVIEETEARCPVMNLLLDAKVDLNVEWWRNSSAGVVLVPRHGAWVMPRDFSRLSRIASTSLNADEQFVAAANCKSEEIDAPRSTHTGTCATGKMPSGITVALTQDRLFIFAHSLLTSRPSQIAGIFSINEIAGIETQMHQVRRRSVRQVSVLLKDNTYLPLLLAGEGSRDDAFYAALTSIQT
jgi:hypothetical protein